MSWDLIIWKKENAIDYVPSVWCNDDKTLYKYPFGLSEQRIRQVIYECQDISSNYKWYEASVKKSGIKSLKKAQTLCSKGQYFSNISDNTEDENEAISLPIKRKKTKRLLDDYEYEDSQNSCSQQKRKRLISENEDAHSNTKESNESVFVFKTPSAIRNKKTSCRASSQDSDSETEDQVHNKNDFFPKSNNICESRKSYNIPEVNDYPDEASVNDYQTQEIDETMRMNDSRLSNTSSSSTLTLHSNFNSASDILSEILKNQIEMKYTLKGVLKRIDHLDNLLKVTSCDLSTIEESVLINKLPCGKIEDINAMEAFILEPKNFAQLVNFLYLLGGESDTKSVYYIMKKLLTNELAVQYSGVGKKKKLPFCSLQIYKAVVAATRKRHANASDEHIRKTVSLYLAQSKSRIPK